MKLLILIKYAFNKKEMGINLERKYVIVIQGVWIYYFYII